MKKERDIDMILFIRCHAAVDSQRPPAGAAGIRHSLVTRDTLTSLTRETKTEAKAQRRDGETRDERDSVEQSSHRRVAQMTLTLTERRDGSKSEAIEAYQEHKCSSCQHLDRFTCSDAAEAGDGRDYAYCA